MFNLAKMISGELGRLQDVLAARREAVESNVNAKVHQIAYHLLKRNYLHLFPKQILMIAKLNLKALQLI